MRINKKILPLKAHFFFFMASTAPVTTQLSVYGKELGISATIMGTVIGLIPFGVFVARMVFGLLVDVYRDYRKAIFMILIVIMTLAHTLMVLIPRKDLVTFKLNYTDMYDLDTCTSEDLQNMSKCHSRSLQVSCTSEHEKANSFMGINLENQSLENRTCKVKKDSTAENITGILNCIQNTESEQDCLYQTFTFWAFILLLSAGTIGYYVIYSMTDAICYDIIDGTNIEYGRQRVWGTIGCGIAALGAGLIMDLVSGDRISYTPALVIILVCTVIDLLFCSKLELPIIEPPKNILTHLGILATNLQVAVFMLFSMFAGLVDSLPFYFLFWYIEDLAAATKTSNIKTIIGLTVACQCVGETVFFSLSNKIIKKLGHVLCLSMCFGLYALRLGLISIVPSPWWIVLLESVLEGATYAPIHSVIVAYANQVSPPELTATVQGIAAGLDDGVGYGIGSMLAGALYKHIGGKSAFQVFGGISLLCCFANLLLYKTVFREPIVVNKKVTSKTSAEDIITNT